MVLKPGNWNYPKHCGKIVFKYDGKEYKQQRCLYDECPVGKWSPPKKVFESMNGKTKTMWLTGKCLLNIIDEKIGEKV